MILNTAQNVSRFRVELIKWAYTSPDVEQIKTKIEDICQYIRATHIPKKQFEQTEETKNKLREELKLIKKRCLTLEKCQQMIANIPINKEPKMIKEPRHGLIEV